MMVDALKDRKTSLVVSPRPLAREEEVCMHALPEGLSLAEMVASLEASGALDPALRPWVRISVGGVKAPTTDWPSVRPRAEDTVVVEVAPMAGSNAVRTLLQIAVIALSIWVPGAIGLSGLAAAGATAAINVGGMIAVNAIAPIKQPEVAGREQRYSLDGGSNAARPHEAIPIIMGRRRIYPPRCANWYTVTVNNTVYLRQMFQPCATWVDHESARIGQTDLASFEGVNVRWSTRHDEGLEPIWFQRTPAEDSLALPVKQASGWITRAAPLESDALSIDIAFMAGLFETKESSGNPKNRSVTFEFRYGPRGGDPWSATPCPFAGPGGQLTFTRDKLDSYRVGWEWPVERGQYDVHVRRVTNEESNNPKISDELTWICIRSFRDEPPVRDLASKPWIELELQASDQLNGVPNDFNFIATSIVPEATATGPGDLVVTRNPADLFLAASYPPMSDVELDDDERAFAAIADWRALCQEQGWMCDLAEAGEMSVGELLQRTAAAGRARPTLDYGALSVVVDWEKPLPRQMFTPRNVSGFRGELTYPAPVHALRVRFANAEKDFADDVVTVFGQRPDGAFYDLDTADKYERVEVRDKVDADAVVLEGARMLAERVLRPETFSFEQDVEYLTIREGDRAWLAHHVALVGEMTGRVRARVSDESDPAVKGLRLDELVTMVAGRSYDLAWRPSADASIEVFPLETLPGQSDIVWFAAPVPTLGDQPLPGDQVTVFDHAVELLDVIVDRIAPKEGLKASITCVPYAEALQRVGDEPIPAYRTGVSRPPTLPGAIVVRRDDRAIDKVIDALAEGVSQAGGGVDAVTQQVKVVDGASRETAKRLAKQALDAWDLARKAEDKLLGILDGRPVGPVLAEHKGTIANHRVQIADNAAAISIETLDRITSISSEAAARMAVETSFMGFQSSASLQLASLSTAQETMSGQFTSLSSDYNGHKATTNSTLLTYANNLTALASADLVLAATVDENKAIAAEGLLVLADADKALSDKYTVLKSTTDDSLALYDGRITTAATKADSAATKVDLLRADFDGNKATVSDQITVLSNKDLSLADDIKVVKAAADGIDATVKIQGTTVADVASKVASGRLVLEAAASGGRPARFGLYSDSLGSSNLALSAAQIWFGDNTVLDDASDTLRSDLGSTAYIQAWGAAFGVSSDLLLWFGPAGIGYWAASRANAYFYLAKTAPYLGGSALPTGGGGGFEINLSTPLVSANRFGTGLATTDTVTATTAGGDGPVTFSWAYLSGAGFTPTGTTGDAIAFTGNITALGQTLDGYWRVTARDAAGHVAFADVRILISENS